MNDLEQKKELNAAYLVPQVLIILLFEYIYKDLDSELKLYEKIRNFNWKKKYAIKRIFEFQLSILDHHSKSNIVPPVTYRKIFNPALRAFPNDPKFLSSFIEHESRSQLQNRIRRFFDEFCNK